MRVPGNRAVFLAADLGCVPAASESLMSRSWCASRAESNLPRWAAARRQPYCEFHCSCDDVLADDLHE